MKYLIAALLAASLSGCGGGGGGGGSGGGGVTPEYADSTADTFANKIEDGGVTGSMALIDISSASGDRDEIKVEVSSDLSTATLTLNGQVLTLTSPGGPLTPGAGLYVNDGGNKSINFLGNDYLGVIYYTNSNTGEFGIGVIGAETRPENLPSGTASYDGLYQFLSNGAAGGTGFVDINVDFGTGDVDGVFRDGLADTDVFGDLVGEITSNGFDGLLTLDDTALSGTMDIDGTFYGPSGEQLGGIMSGTVATTTGGNVIIAGQFTADRN